jgi:hypothetical protein
MAKAKTFVDGELLTASDINTYLNPEIPTGATVYDTGWVNLTATGVTTNHCAVRRIGKTVHFRAEFWSVTAGTMLTLATEFRPGRRLPVICPRYATGNVATNQAALLFDTDGTVAVVVAVGTAVTAAPGYVVNATWAVA